MAITEEQRQILRENSRDEAEFNRLLELFEHENASSERFYTLIKALPDLMFRMSADGIYLDYYAADPNELLVPPEVFLGKHIAEVLPPELSPMFIEGIATALKTHETLQFEYPLVIQDETVYFEARLVRVNDNEVVTVVRNITDRKRAEQSRLESERLRFALHQEREFSHLKTKMMERISHEFRTPLAVIQSSADLLGRYLDRLSEQSRLARLNVIQGEIQHLAHMLDSIMTLVKDQLGHAALIITTFDFGLLCSEVLEHARVSYGVGHTLTRQIADDLPPITADRENLRAMLTNLLANAVKYSAEGSTVTLTLTTDGEGDDRMFMLQVSDSGIGIPEIDLPHIFQPFYRGSNINEVSGMGLGLAIVKKVVDQHGGVVTVDTIPQQGTTFTVGLPLAVVEHPLPDHRGVVRHKT